MRIKLLLFLLTLAAGAVSACPRLSPSFTITYSNTCGTPRTATITNTTTGADSAVSTYRYFVDGQLLSTIVGTGGTSVLVTGTGLKRISMIVTDTSGCVDSSFTTTTITTNAAQLRDQNNLLSYTPTWINCIQLAAAPDSFQITTSSNDTLRRPIFIWGDGSQDVYSTDQNPNTNFSHWFTSTGIFTVRIVQRSGSCTDTIYGTVVNLRQPTAGLIGPGSNNAGCVPHTLTMTNNSSNISRGTQFTWDWADGTTSSQNWTQNTTPINHTYFAFLCNANVRLTATNACGSSFTTWNPINISDTDLAEFGIDSSNCDPTMPFTFNNLSTDQYCLIPDPKQYYWDWGDGSNSGWIGTRAAQTHIYATPGPKTITLIARNNCGDDTIQHSFDVVFTPQAGFIIDTTSGCGSATVFVDDTSSGFNATRSWDFGDGTNSTADTVTHYYNTPGTYYLVLSITNRCGTVTARDTINIYNDPIAGFNDTAGGCAPHTINPVNLSTSDFNPPLYYWDFGNGGTSTNASPGAITYLTPGTYSLKLRVTDLCGADSLSATIVVDTTPVASVFADTTICAFDTLWFTNTSLQYQYLITEYGDGTRDTLTTNGTYYHVYSNPGNLQIIYIAQSPSGCEHRDTQSILVRSSAQANFTVNQTQACAPFTFTFTNTSLLANQYRWYVNDTLRSITSTLNPITVSTDSTFIRVKLWAVDSTSCFADSIEQTLFTSRSPIATIANPLDSNCGPFLDTFNNTSQFASSYIWDFGNGNTSNMANPSETFVASLTQDTNYNIVLRSINWMGCEDTALATRKVYPLPTTQFNASVTSGCGPLNVVFTNNSTPNDTGSIQIMAFNWDFGDGNSSTSTQVNHNFSADLLRDTIYRVLLTGNSEHGCVNEDSVEITVYPNPTVAFSLSDSQGCAPLAVSFTNQSTPNDTGSIQIMTFNWDLGDGSSSSLQNPVNSYIASLTQDSIYPIKLIGMSEHNCRDSAVDTIRIFPKPTVQYTQSADSGCSPLDIQFINNSTPHDTGSIQIMSFLWDFGNGTQSNARDTLVRFLDQPLYVTTYNVQLIGTSEHGCLDTATSTSTVHPKPYPFFTADRFNGCGPLTVNFTSSSTLANEYYWDFGSGFNLGQANMTQTFQSIDLADTLYHVRLYVTSNRNCQSDDTFDLPIVVRANPIANFSMSDDSICVEQLSLFYNLSQGASQFKWHFGTGDSSTRYNPVYNYPPAVNPFIPSVYSVKLEATNFFGCKDSLRRDLYVFPAVNAQFTVTPDSACAPLIAVYTNNSINHNASFWEFGDGDTSSLENPTHRFDNYTTNNLTYRTILRASNQYGCVDYDSINLTTIPVPYADFVAIRTDICDSGYYDLVNRSVNAPQYLWDFGDGSTNTTANPRHKFERSVYQDASYTITLTASNSYGCSEQISRTITLPVRMVTRFDTVPFRTVCQPASVPFMNRTTHALYQVWHFEDGGISTDSLPTHIFVDPGIFGVKLVSYDRNSCPDSFESAAILEVLEKPRANFTFNPASPKIPNANVFFTSLSSPNGLTHTWDFGDGGTGTGLSPVHMYTDSGYYTIVLSVTNGLCADTIQQTIYVEPPIPSIDFTASDTAGCGPFTVQFFENTIDATSFRWIFDDGQESTDPNPTHTFMLPGYYNITLRAFGPGGSSFETKDSFIYVYPKPNAFFAASPRTRYLPSAIFTLIDGSADATSWEYLITHDSLPQFQYTFTDQSPQFQLTVPGYYTVRLIVTNANGCRDTSLRTALLYVAAEGRVLVPNAFSPNGDGNNETFKPVILGVLDSGYTFQIFDRWGMKLFETHDINAAWDGRVKDNLVLMDAYIWLINGKFADGTLFEEKGTVTLLR